MRDDLDQQEQDERREVDPAEVGQDLADRPVKRLGDPIERPYQAGRTVGEVEDVEGDQPAEDDLGDDDPVATWSRNSTIWKSAKIMEQA